MPELNKALNSPRLIGAPPGLPANIRPILEDAIKKAVEDPGFQETAKKMRKTTDYLNGRDTEKLMNNVMQSYQNYSPIVRELFGQDKK